MIRALARAGVAVLCAGLAAGCGSAGQSPTASAYDTGSGVTSAASAIAVPLSTSLVTAQGTWAIAVMGGSAASENNFWQLFVRPAGASRWSLVTPPGVADNGGLVAAGVGGSLVVGFRPSQDLAFSPLAASSDTGKSWTPGLLDADLASSPDAIAISPSGRALALLQDGTIETAATAAAAAAGTWSRLTTLPALAASAPGRRCGLVGAQAVSFGSDGAPMAAGTCSRPGVVGVFTDYGGTWRSAGLTLPAPFGGQQVQVLGLTATSGGSAALLLAGDSLLAAWSDGTRWTVSAPVGTGAVRASGFGPGGSAWLLLSGGRAETISGPGGSWRALPALPADTETLAPAGSGTLAPGSGAGSGGTYQALAVSGTRLTVWQLNRTGWADAQRISVPISYGSSS